MTDPRFIVGIDLGTTHCAVAESTVDRPVVRLVEVPQLIAPGELASRFLLPSMLYLPTAGELAENDLALPWGHSPRVVGELARNLGAKVPGRFVASAKSWVCHGGVNRRAPILPWGTPDEAPHVSPFEAEVAFLGHLRAAWELRHRGLLLAEQDVVVTVPASFDESAREITADAAREAGLGDVRLLEEPQAAFYDFLGAHTDDLAGELAGARLILVVDVGGGTTDLTLLRVTAEKTATGEPRIERIAVGGHLMLGGDNMDAALAQHALRKAGVDRDLDPTEWSALIHSARHAKEQLLAANAPDRAVVSFQGRGSRLVASTRSITISREEATEVLLDGFLPLTEPTETATRSIRTGLTTLGLPYVTDPAIPRHVCAFLRRHVVAATAAGAEVHDGLPRPDLLLLNGGVFNGSAIVERTVRVFQHWYGETTVRLLQHTSLETAVARGAVRYGLARRGLGEVIGGGTARAYYIGIEATADEHKALCIVPRGMEEGATVELPQRVFGLVLDRPVTFPLYAYTGDRGDAAGTVVEVSEELERLPPLETVVRGKADSPRPADGTVPVTLHARIDESGAVELHLVTLELPPRRWRLDFAVAGNTAAPPASDATSHVPAEPPKPHEQTIAATEVLARAFCSDDPKPVKAVRADIENVIGPRGQWSAATCRALLDDCIVHERQRRKSALHELNWLRLAGWCMRPGFGVPGDSERLEWLWLVHDAGLQKRDKANWAEWWILWRRVAAGLDASLQLVLFGEIEPWLWPAAKPVSGPHAHGQVEMLQLLASLERLPQDKKIAAGEVLFDNAGKIGSYWPLGRLGSRVPFHGESSDVVGRAIAERWLKRLLALDWRRAEGASFAAAAIARFTGDPERDVDASLRDDIASRLAAVDSPASWVDMVLRPAGLSDRDLGRMFGESLPVGLRFV